MIRLRQIGWIAVILSLALPFYSRAEQGGVDAGGGGAFVCPGWQFDGDIRSSELLDLWEAHWIRKWPIERSDAPVEEQMNAAIDRLAKIDVTLAEFVRKESFELKDSMEFLPPEVEIAPPSDALNGYMKRGCPLQGMMYYDGEFGRVRANRQIFGKLLSNTDRAAAFLHEGIYKHYRFLNNDKDSRMSRRLVGCLFSASNCIKSVTFEEGLAKAKAEGDVYRCVGPKVEYYTWFTENGKEPNHLFRSLDGRLFTQELKAKTRTVIDIPMTSLKQFNYRPLTVSLDWYGRNHGDGLGPIKIRSITYNEIWDEPTLWKKQYSFGSETVCEKI